MAVLRSGTHLQHRDTERRQAGSGWLDSPGSYAAFLRRLLTFHRALEAAVAPAVAELPGLDFGSRRRTKAIEADLRALREARGSEPEAGGSEPEAGGSDLEAGRLGVGRPGAVLPAAPGIPPVRALGVSAALGYLYVVEGATLGGRVTARWVGRELGFEPGRGASWMVPYGSSTLEMWRRFGDVVEDWAAGDGRRSAVMVAAARRCFADYSHTVLRGTVRRDAPPGDLSG